MTPKEYMQSRIEDLGTREAFINELTEKVGRMRLHEIIRLNPSLREMRNVEYVRDIGYGYYPHHNDYELLSVIEILRLNQKF